MNAVTSKSGALSDRAHGGLELRSCAERGARGDAHRGCGAAGGGGYPAHALDGAGDGEAPNGLLVRGLLPKDIHPPQNGFPLGDALQLAPGALQLHPPPFLPLEEAHFPLPRPPSRPSPPRCRSQPPPLSPPSLQLPPSSSFPPSSSPSSCSSPSSSSPSSSSSSPAPTDPTTPYSRSRRRVGRRGERRGVAWRSGVEGAEELEVEVGVELELELKLELELGLLLWTWG